MEHGIRPPPNHSNKKKFVILGGGSILLVAMVVGVAVGITSHRDGGGGDDGSSSGQLSTSAKSVQAICHPTDFRETCESVLTAAGGKATDNPKDLVKLAFNVTVDYIHAGLKNSTLLAKLEKDPRTSAALHDCQELLDNAIDDLKESLDHLGGADITKVDDLVTELKVWLSAAITDQETCLDGFEKTTGDAGEKMKKALKKSMELTRNALAIIDEIYPALVSFQLPSLNRRLLLTPESGEIPEWVGTANRLLLDATVGGPAPNVVVAQDGSGNYKTINESLNAVPKKSDKPFVIYVKEGVYYEHVMVTRDITNLIMIGDGPNKTKITGNLNFIDGTPTFKTATLSVVGDGFIGKNLWIENSAGPEKHQAVALRVQSDKSVFYNCRMDGYQDTLYAHSKRQFYRNCTISGTIDFLFGNSPAIFQNCLFLVRQPMANQQNIVTAQGRKDRREPTAIILHNCTIAADPVFYSNRTSTQTYLGRPWKEYSRTFILQSEIGDFIHPDGWMPWSGDFGLKTCFYTEFDNRGPGAGTAQRVKWKGIKNINYQHAMKFTVESFIQGSSWLQGTGVPYIPGLLPPAESSRIH